MLCDTGKIETTGDVPPVPATQCQCRPKKKKKKKTPPRSKCKKCKATIRHGGPRNLCRLCQADAHLSCSGGRNSDWTCAECENTPQLPVAAQQDLPSSQCNVCPRKINRNAPRVTCTLCQRGSHVKCTGSTRSEQEAARANTNWMCNPCKTQVNSRRQRNPDSTLPATAPTAAQKSIRILQWNAGGIHGKLHELESFLAEKKVDICCLQETKMIPNDNTPIIRNYVAVRHDRLLEGMARGGGLICFIRDDLKYRIVDCVSANLNIGMEGQTVEIITGEREPLRISNIYMPPDSSPVLQRMNPADEVHLQIGENEVLLGDLNAHNSLWDSASREELDATPQLVTSLLLI